MMKKFINRPLFGLAILFSILFGLQLPFNTITYSYIFYLISHKSVKMIVPAISLIILGYGIFAILGYIQNVIINKNIYAINSKLKQSFVNSKISEVTSDENNFESKNLSFFMNDLKLLEDNYWRQIFTLLGSVVMTIGTLSYALYSNVYITLIFLAFMLVPTIAPKFFSKSIETKTNTWSKKNQVLSATVQNLLHGALLLRRYHATTGFSRRLKTSVSEMESANANMKNQIALSNSLIGFLFDICSYLPIGLGIYFTIRGRITLAQFVAIQYSSAWILNGFNSVMTGWNTINSTKDIRSKIGSLKPVSGSKKESQSIVVKQLRVADIAFKFANKTIFQQVSFQITRGQKILISGKSGVGKSTLMRIILRELQPTVGELFLNNGKYTQNDAYNIFGVVGQTPIIFEDSLRDNITLGQSSDDGRLIEVLKLAGLSEFSNKDSLNMQISENGHNLSGGQLKRVEIARALYFNRQILLVDEGTASLDPETSAAIHESLLNNPDLTIIEVDHHIPDTIRSLYTHTFELQATGLKILN